MCVLIVEDDPGDMELALEVTRAAGFRSINGEGSLRGAKRYLEEALEGERRLPDVIVLDLVLGMESGYELLRLRYLSHSLAPIKVIVWSEHYEPNREIREVFNVDRFVGKWTGAAGLQKAIGELNLPRKGDGDLVAAGPVATGKCDEAGAAAEPSPLH